MRNRAIRNLALALGLTLVGACADRLPADPSCVSDGSTPTWGCLSDAELLSAISRADGVVMIGFKEAGTVRGVDPRGLNLTSDTTRQSGIRLLLARGVTVSHQFVTIPGVVAVMPLNLSLLSELRAHPNVDYIEPNSVGRFTGL